MSQPRTILAYSPASRLAHWTTAGLMVLAFALVWLREELPKGDLRSAMLVWHQWTGLLILFLLLPRLLARCLGRAPSLSDMPLWQRLTARGTEVGLYLLMVAQPLMGWFTSNLKGHAVTLFGMPLPTLAAPDRPFGKMVEGWHEATGWVILALLGLHVLGALYHHFWRRDGILLGMLGAGRRAGA